MMYASTEIEGKDDEKHQELESLQYNIALCVSQGPMNSLFFFFSYCIYMHEKGFNFMAGN